MEYFLIGLAMSILIALVLGAIVGYSLLMERLTTRRPKSETPKAETPAAPSLTDRIMSRLLGSAGPIEVAGNAVAQTLPEAGQGVAKPGNTVNTELPGNMLPEEVREIMRFQAKVEAVEAILKSGKIGQVEAIETVFECKRSGRPESVYARAVAAMKVRSNAVYRANQARLEEIRAEQARDIEPSTR